MHMFKKQNGFTMIELMITLVIASIVLGVAIPSFNTQVANNRSVALAEDFVTAVNFVRSEALKRRVLVSLCASSNGTTCVAGINGWRDGFIAVVDRAATESAVAPLLTNAANPVSTILRVWKKQDDNAVITVTQGADATFLRYTGLGTLARVSANPVIISAKLAKCSNNAARTITIGLSGLVNVAKVACAP
jgi:type IV fimbrial biogenesis protein FimT